MSLIDDDETPFYAYTKGSGLTGKKDGLGSFGIGKKAPVVNSALRTIFVSTVYNNPKYGNELLAQGMSFWVTHKEGDDAAEIARSVTDVKKVVKDFEYLD